MDKKFHYFRLLVWLALCAGIIWLAWLKIVPSGKISYSRDFDRDSFFIGKLSPAERVEPPENNSQIIKGNPVYFSVNPPRGFDSARLTVKFRISSSTPIVEAGILTDKFWHYRLKPLENAILDEREKKWPAAKKGSLMLLQREKIYAEIDDFFARPPSADKIAVYNYSWDREFVLPDYQKKNNFRVLPASVRGAFNFYVYVKDEVLDLDFSFSDLNKNKDPDPIEARLFFGGRAILEKALPDDGNASDDGKIGQTGAIHLKAPSLPEGVYKIEVLANDDIITEKLITSQTKLSFLNKLWLYGLPDAGLEIFTDSRDLAAQTNNPASRQKITSAGNTFELTETYRQYDFHLPSAESPAGITLEKGDTLLSGGGCFSFTENEFFNPDVKKVLPGFNPDISGTDFIIAEYIPPRAETPALGEDEPNWLIASALFDLTEGYIEKGRYNFMISVPGLKAEDEINDYVEISEIQIEFTGKNLGQKIKESYEKIF